MRAPDYIGIAGKAWNVSLEATRKSLGTTPEEDTSIAVWVVEAPHSHPIWWWYRIILIHLRPTPELGEATIHLPGATHELSVDALDPEYYPPPVDVMPMKYLEPMNFAAQFIASDDAAAIKYVKEQAILPIVHGMLNPDTDGRRRWVELFGGNMLKEAIYVAPIPPNT